VPNRRSIRPVDILLVEDNPADIRLTREAFAEAGIAGRLHVATDGVEALLLLQDVRNGTFWPDLILLDLNLPKKDGREVLAEIKADPALRGIPVIVLTTSRAEEDVARAYQLHANAFVSKPVGFQDFLAAVRSLQRFWLAVATLPGAVDHRR
jgi:CheY-like chemotaxis protein